MIGVSCGVVLALVKDYCVAQARRTRTTAAATAIAIVDERTGLVGLRGSNYTADDEMSSNASIGYGASLDKHEGASV